MEPSYDLHKVGFILGCDNAKSDEQIDEDWNKKSYQRGRQRTSANENDGLTHSTVWFEFAGSQLLNDPFPSQ